MKPSRESTLKRDTNETRIELRLELDGTGRSTVSTGLGFLDHMLTSLAKHARFDLELTCQGDLEVDDHHTVEDVALSLGAALDRALEDRRGIERFGSAMVPLDEALARVAIDLSGRAFSHVDLRLVRESIGAVATENITHFFRSFAQAARLTLHVDVLSGENDHHKIEAAFKAMARSLRAAVRLDGSLEIPSTKGVLV